MTLLTLIFAVMVVCCSCILKYCKLSNVLSSAFNLFCWLFTAHNYCATCIFSFDIRVPRGNYKLSSAGGARLHHYVPICWSAYLYICFILSVHWSVVLVCDSFLLLHWQAKKKSQYSCVPPSGIYRCLMDIVCTPCCQKGRLHCKLVLYSYTVCAIYTEC